VNLDFIETGQKRILFMPEDQHPTLSKTVELILRGRAATQKVVHPDAGGQTRQGSRTAQASNRRWFPEETASYRADRYSPTANLVRGAYLTRPKLPKRTNSRIHRADRNPNRYPPAMEEELKGEPKLVAQIGSDDPNAQWEVVSNFRASNHWRQSLFRRWEFSLRRPTPKRRPMPSHAGREALVAAIARSLREIPLHFRHGVQVPPSHLGNVLISDGVFFILKRSRFDIFSITINTCLESLDPHCEIL
jgi:hypothetical protein